MKSIMKKKQKSFYFMTATAIAGIAAVAFYQWWTAPYNLPEVAEGITAEEYGFILEPENQAQQKINAISEHDKIMLLKQAVEKEPNRMAYANALRIQMREQGEIKTYLEYLEQIKPSTPALKLQKALSYVDLLQDPDLGTASLGQLSARSISVLNDLIEDRPYDWFAHYARGLNNLYWPSGLQRTDKAIQDLGYCLAVAKQLEGGMKLSVWPLIYTAYGDALVKEGQIKKGIEVWKDGFQKYKEDEELKRRASVGEVEAVDIVREARGIDDFRRPSPSLSDLSLVWTFTE
ncbi:hypothetical protein [Paenibacillus kobensis]|uniref:hypothetical protein n=1 Tax=Paenibacillus kobensis TaxID=59841 RepID=UPI000FD801F6|nr:hypothetical protein [Paenibacillus kobensis]